MLPRSGTGQVMTSYINWITGPSRSADIEQSLTIGVHGPREMHCVILDNGREEMRADPIFRDALTCIRCGACSNACPPFMAVGGHQFGHIYNGPIGLVLTPFHHGIEQADLSNTLCTQCNACQEICPVDIPLPRQILEHRRQGRKSLRKKALIGVWKRKELADRLLRAGAPLSGLVPGQPKLARVPFRDRLDGSDEGQGDQALTIFASCMVDRMLPEAAVALRQIADTAGYRVEFPKGQWCCGLIAANAGDFAGGAALHDQLAKSLGNSKGLIVTPSASCFGAFTIDAPDWGAEEEDALRSRFRDSTRFALDLLTRRPDLMRPNGRGTKVAYHDSCQTLRQLGLKAEPRKLLELAGYEVVDIPDIANCCGFGGTFSVEWPRVAGRLAKWKLDAIAKTGCTLVASDNPGCLIHIATAARRRRIDLRVAHVLELVAEHLATPGR
jgi:Fe-S oxidoreductase